MLTLQLWWLFSLRRVSPRRSRDVRKVLGHRPAAAEEPWAQFLRTRESRMGYWSAAVAGLGWTSWVRVGSALGQECLTLVLSHYVVRGHFPFPSSQLACSLRLLMINEFPLSSCSSPGNRQWVEEGSGQELASLMSSTLICPLSWGIWTGVGISDVLRINMSIVLPHQADWHQASSSMPLPVLVDTHLSQISTDASKVPAASLVFLNETQ